MKNRAKQPENRTSHQPCEMQGCVHVGEYRAPKHQHSIGRDYRLFCLEHIREFNKNYNFFKDMDNDRVQAFMKDAVTGHRPTWQFGKDHSLTKGDLEESLRRFFGDPTPTSNPSSLALPQPLQKALATFSLTHPTVGADIKKRYKQLVKAYHPDVNKQPDAAEKFKEITKSYKVLIDHYPSVL